MKCSINSEIVVKRYPEATQGSCSPLLRTNMSVTLCSAAKVIERTESIVAQRKAIDRNALRRASSSLRKTSP